MDATHRKTLIVSIVISLVAGFGGGFWLFQFQYFRSLPIVKTIVNQERNRPQDVDFGLFWEVWEALNDKYVDKDKLDAQDMVYGAIEGMVNTAKDPYTVFFEPVTSSKFKEEISGEFGGVGIEIGIRNEVLTVIAPLEDTPAHRAGIKAGDKILKIDSQSTEGMAIDEAVNLIRGRKGTKVVLTVISNGDKTTKDHELTRDTIKVPTIKWKLIDGHIAYIQIFSFNQNVDLLFKEAAEEILKSKADRLIVDLRNNPGGLLDAAINLAGWFLDKGAIVTSEVFGNGTQNDFRADGKGLLKIYPTVVLINGGSASASEILAGALHDNRGIKLVGEKSFGKGSVQELENFDNGSSLKVTIAKWLTPSGISISEKGIEADIEVKITEEDRAKEDFRIGDPGHDPQLDKALDLLR
ncbi:MAG: hypothetical protein A3B99_00245 [Candidatus Yanofskybacteria bacterium RIFCSPHIGHO2_02_FULL_44_12b]|uniref:PDZ domain-containing protein n=2 Tax=Candidatus Yanofskyibacteriota TaxID=1752733 RepID=A0A1F8GKH2_9BACT|nr:MAG: Carboxyl-terminal protease [Candidatus Yanofskybacteria bacterium GW2011_GWA2_44_9]OGN04181.1 MAG: hypothetical protein A2659_01690 [Candidatus Yanofskybacteria bacterium RIFCSPHIGHO2_01_FULL_44_24]OGN14775.1 MAG: hypothetical protein A3B99_00245 [Candidatus Yanofskybacteria bacterium RIFCSPHIGHO2_02_FULL_44_12b]OGN25907.1 MAG: hypothetical protein A2925_02610 [Candidatus Yanofskybacteria bacterium RIFCSPLOWO2_01_FULL_44_22]